MINIQILNFIRMSIKHKHYKEMDIAIETDIRQVERQTDRQTNRQTDNRQTKSVK